MNEIFDMPAWLRPKIDAYWSAALACPTHLLYADRPVVIESSVSPGILGIELNRRWIFTINPAHIARDASTLVETLLTLPQAALLSGAQVQRLLGQFGFCQIYGPAYLLYTTPLTFQPLAANGQRLPPCAIRPLDRQVQPIVANFQQEMGMIAWRLDQPTLWPKICGVFADDQLVATGAVRLWGNVIGEIFVDTLPAYRNRGYAKALASHLTDWMLRETPWIPQYDTEAENFYSLRVAARLGFQRYGVMLVAD